MFRPRAYTLIEMMVAVVIVCTLMTIFLPCLAHTRSIGYRTVCALNLRQVGLAVIAYSMANNDAYPAIAPPRGLYDRAIATNDRDTSWRNLAKSGIDDPFDHHSPNRMPIHKSVTAGLWLLCRPTNGAMPPKLFICPAVRRKRARDDPMTESDGSRRAARYFSDFYVDPEVGPLIGYSFHNPWSSQWHAGVTRPGFVLAGDENNGLDPTAHEFKGDPDRYRIHTDLANSVNHSRQGQNLLTASGSVGFQTTPHAGLNGDNVYTACKNRTGISKAPRYQPGTKDIHPKKIDSDTILIPIDDMVLKDQS